jgi:hypothetical protein
MSKKGHSFNCLMSDVHYQQLTELAEATERSMGSTVRALITAAHNMKLKNLATCATGMRCYVPQMHPVTAQAAQPAPAPAPAAPPAQETTA